MVDNRIEEDQKLVGELLIAGFDVSVAFWVKTSDEGLWFLYVGSASLEAEILAMPSRGSAHKPE